MSHVEKLRFAFVQNKFQQTNKTEINYIIDNHINFEVSLHFLGIWPTLWHSLKTYLKKTTPVLDVAVAPMSLGSKSVKFVKCFQWGVGVFSNLKQVLTSPPQACKLKQLKQVSK